MEHLWIVLFALFVSPAFASNNFTFNWANVTATSRTTTTLQVVVNPIMASTSPIRDAVFESLAALEADMVRFVPWFPYPKRGVAELQPPTATQTFWNFTWIEPELERFMNATYGRNHTTLINFSTQPTWLYNTSTWSYPSDPNAVDFSYDKGNPIEANIPKVAAYYGRLLSWLTKGEFTDEHGKVHTGGHHYKLTHWEVFNEEESEHHYDVATYTKSYDAVVREIRRVADPEHQIKFVGVSGAPYTWVPYFLNRSNHDGPDIPLDYFSLHFYAGSSSRTDPMAYEGFFGDADGFINTMVTSVLPVRAALSPDTKIDLDELGVILPGDNTPGSPNPDPIYWNAAGAMYAYLFARLAPLGVEVLGHSQLCGSPAIPEWGIPNPQYPSVSLTNWTNGQGNARYWVLKLLIDHFQIGDQFVETVIPPRKPTNPFCGVVNGHNGYANMTLQCAVPTTVINSIDFAAFGTPTGTCGNYSHNPKCDAPHVQEYVEKECVGHTSCTIPSYPGPWGDPCVGVYKTLTVQARCSGQGGTASPPAGATADVHAIGAIDVRTKQRKVLLINKKNSAATARVDSTQSEMPAGPFVMYVVDLSTFDGPPRKQVVTDLAHVPLAAFAVGVLYLDAA